ncbi:MAG: cyclopropane fatty acyl phospholipid synthase [Phycisphaerales bacterium]|nr:cyclopropane fatty acyl phospholipid synthase [Phycisphaerales bacterium]
MTRTLLLKPEFDTDQDATCSQWLAAALRDPRALRQFKRRGLLGLGEAYMDGLWEADQLDELMYRLFTIAPQRLSAVNRGRMLATALWSRLVDQQAGRGAFRIGRAHYDLGNDLFSVMLDRSLTYTSGYWASAKTLDEAQEAKLELLCQKLDLQPGMRVLDIGCGWGNFAAHAAAHHGVHVTGITVSGEQAAMATERCDGLPVDIQVQDYRHLSGTYDRIVSIEMIEAVGRRNIPKFMGVVDRSLAADGLFAMQVISGDMLSRTSDRRMDQFILFLLKYIFPDGYLPHPRELSDVRGTGLRVEDWHVFSGDYDRTLMAWSDRFNGGWESLAGRYDERFKRRWNYYLHGCAAAFRAGHIDVQQIVYSKGACNSRYQPIR